MSADNFAVLVTAGLQSETPRLVLLLQQVPTSGEYRLGKYLYLKSPRAPSLGDAASSVFAVLGNVVRNISKNPDFEARGAQATPAPSLTGNGIGA